MELLVNPTSYKNALNLIKLGVHQICVGFNDLSVRSSCNCTLKEIETLTKQKKTKVNILFNKVYFEPEIENLEKSLKQICKLNIHGVIFADYAVVQICYEQKLHPYLIYHPETLNVNYGQIPFFIKNHINEIVLAREIDVKDLKLIAAHKQSLKTQIQVAGYSYMMDSR
jgi:collagenase-like PrtC family protease